MEIVPKNIFYFLASNFRKFIDAIFLGDVQGISNLPNPPFIIACNHISIPDGWLISGVMVGRFKMPAWFIVRDDFWWGRAWSNFVADRLGGLIIDWRKPREIIKKALNILSFGGIVGIFPEGTRNPNSKSLALGKTGVARIALGSGCPVIPVAYFGPSIATTMDGIKNFI